MNQTEVKFGYKVVRDEMGVFLSSFMYNQRTQITYGLDKVAKPKIKGTKLFAFRTLKDALAYRIGTDRIFRAAVWNPTRSHALGVCVGTKLMQKFCATPFAEQNKIPNLPLAAIDYDTKNVILADAILLLDEIHES